MPLLVSRASKFWARKEGRKMLIALAIWTDQQEEPLRDELETKSFEEAIAPLLKEGLDLKPNY